MTDYRKLGGVVNCETDFRKPRRDFLESTLSVAGLIIASSRVQSSTGFRYTPVMAHPLITALLLWCSVFQLNAQTLQSKHPGCTSAGLAQTDACVSASQSLCKGNGFNAGLIQQAAGNVAEVACFNQRSQ